MNGLPSIIGWGWPDLINALAPLRVESPAPLFAFLAALVAAIHWVARQSLLQPVFRFVPPLIWCYFVPMILSTLKIIPHQSPLYSGFMSDIVLPLIVVLLLVPTDVAAIAQVGPKAIAAMLIGTTGIVVGALGSLALFQALLPEGTLPDETWKGVAALSGSWIGGSPNMAAVKASIGLSDSLFGKIVVVDTVCGYGWLAVLIALVRYQRRVDHLTRADSSMVSQLAVRLARRQAEHIRPMAMTDLFLMLAVGVGVSQFCMMLGARVSSSIHAAEAQAGLMQTLNLSKVMTGFGWGMLLATGVSIVLSLTPLRRMEESGAPVIGNAGLYLLLTTFGAQADLGAIEPGKDVWLIAIGSVWLLIHIAILFAGIFLLRAPMFVGATASMANVGGTASCPVVAAAFHPSLAPLGLLLALLGGILGTPVGLLIVARFAAAIAGV